MFAKRKFKKEKKLVTLYHLLLQYLKKIKTGQIGALVLFVMLFLSMAYYLFILHFSQYIIGGDINDYLFPKRVIAQYSSLWIENIGPGFGSFSVAQIFEMPHIILNYIQNIFGVPNIFFEKINYLLFVALSLWGSYKMLNFYFGPAISRHYKLLISLFYICNMYFLVNLNFPIFSFMAAWTILPWFVFSLGSFLRKMDIKSFLFLVSVNILGLGAISNLAFLPMLVFIAVLVLMVEKKYWWSQKYKLIKFIFILILINIFWMLPFYFFLSDQKAVMIKSSVSQMKSAGDIETSAQYSTMLNTFRFIGTWDFVNSLDGVPRREAGPFYKDYLWLFFLIMVPVFILLFSKKKKKTDLFLIFMYIFFLYLITFGLNSNFFKKFLIDYDLLFFRGGYTKFGFLLLLLYLFIIGRSYILSRKITAVFLFSYVTLCLLSFLNGTFIHRTILNSYHPDYSKVAQILNEDTTLHQIIKLPFPLYVWIGEKGKGWNYWGDYFMFNFLNNNVIEINRHFNNLFVDSKLKEFDNTADGNALSSLLNELNVKYIIVDNYFNDLLDNSSGKKLEKFKNFVETQYRGNEIYSGDLFSVFKNTKLNVAGLNSNDLFFQKINSSKYRLYIENIKSPQKLSFLDSFHKEWRIYIKPNPAKNWCEKLEFYNDTNTTECAHQQKFFEGEELSYLWKKPVFDDTHKTANEYANQWTIDPEYIKQNFSKEYYKENPGGSIDVEMVLYFKPQSYFYLGLIVSGLTLAGLLGYLGYDFIKRRRNEENL